MRAAFVIVVLIELSTGEPVKEPLAVRLSYPEKPVTVQDCERILSYIRSGGAVYPDAPLTPDVLVGVFASIEPRMEKDWRAAGHPIDMIVSCEEREIGDNPPRTSEEVVEYFRPPT